MLSELPESQWPACIAERGTLMAPFEIVRTVVQPYSPTSEAHKHILPTKLRLPPYSVAAIPFRWMNRQFAWQLAEEHGIDASPDREPTDPEWLRNNRWVQSPDNQKALLEGFFSAIQPERSLCFFYAKQTPLMEDERRVIVGVGRVKHVGPLVEYEYAEDRPIRSYIWDRVVQHSIEPEFRDGFLLPYHSILGKLQADSSFNPEDFVAFAPDDRQIEFSYAAEHVLHDAAIAGLLECKR
ncbi:hypothetical protein CVV65_01645 [Kyrpidia spormannii]|uniref:Uncharacterized protein n=1 Tax=Kyrpidia spormannii TaxID=2055160 RepID=A0A2K8N2U6_9BACL|nr:hypothetical protein [Kyrpidia spormannii]ATY83833.1 hypothetical protein CVV65_01645 [Kyrpidia spormannii]